MASTISNTSATKTKSKTPKMTTNVADVKKNEIKDIIKDIEENIENNDNNKDGNKKRHFRVIMDGFEIKDAKGRFSGKKPKQAANKALSSIIKKIESEGHQVPENIKYTLIECTRKDKIKNGGDVKKPKNKRKKKYKQYHYIR